MANVASIASVAALIGDPARAAMLVTLMDGRALAAGELAIAAGVAPPTASGHLMRMLDAGLIALERQGRHRYYRLANQSVAGIIESLMAVSGELTIAAGRVRAVHTGPRDKALRRARLCYDHLAGEVAVGIANSMIARGQLAFGPDGGSLAEEGAQLLAGLGVDVQANGFDRTSGPTHCRPCLDWSERRPHVAGRLGRELYRALLRRGWLRAPTAGRAVSITPPGERGLKQQFGLELG